VDEPVSFVQALPQSIILFVRNNPVGAQGIQDEKGRAVLDVKLLTKSRGSHGCLDRLPRDEERRAGLTRVNQLLSFRPERFNVVLTWLTILERNVIDPSGRVHD